MMKNATTVGQGDEEDPNKITLPWYLLRKQWTIVIIWEQIFSFVVIFNMITVPMMIAYPESAEYTSKKFLWFEIVLECMWLL